MVFITYNATFRFKILKLYLKPDAIATFQNHNHIYYPFKSNICEFPRTNERFLITLRIPSGNGVTYQRSKTEKTPPDKSGGVY